MSDDTSRVEEPSLHAGSVLDWLEDWYHVPALALTLAFMLWVRIQARENFIVNDKVYFSGNDPWYHFRQTVYTVENWPSTMPYDVWTGFPHGTISGQFGTLFDQLMATAALVVGLGDPSRETIAQVVLYAPAVFGTLIAVPVYFMGKRLGGRLSGVVSAGLLALLPGLILQRSLVGAADHNIAEPFFQAVAVLAMMAAIAVAERERPVYEQIVAREFASLRRPLATSVLAGLGTALYLWLWPPGVVLIGIFGLFFVIKLSADFVRGVSPDHLAFVAAVSMGVTAVLSLVPLEEASFSATAPSLIQPVLALAIGAGAVFMAWLARKWEQSDQSALGYPVTVVVLILVGLLAVRFGTPEFWSSIRGNLNRVLFFMRGSAQAGTVSEAQPFLSRSAQFGISDFWVVYLEYGMALFTAAFAALVMLARALFWDEHDGERLLVLVWFAFAASMAFSQVRFNYYLAVPVVVLNGYLVYEVLRFVGFTDLSAGIEDVQWYQVFSVVMVLSLLAVPLVGTSTVGGQGNQVQFGTAQEVGASANPGGVTQWADTLHWMRNNTPEEGTFGGANNEMAYYGTFDRVDDYDYPAGSYGVMSWWDYGHWITVEAERIPNANPFQQQANDAANFLLAPNETAAESVRESLSEDDAETRYVLVDWQMASPTSKFGAPTVFYDAADVNTNDFYQRVYQRTQQGVRTQALLHKQRYYNSTMIRLYRYHGSAMQPNPQVVVDYQPRQGTDGNTYYFAPQGNQSLLRSFDSMAEARQFVEEDGSAQIGGIGRYPSEYVPALQHYRLVQVSEAPAPQQTQISSPRFANAPSYVKAFEHVPGATVEGEGPPNATVTASVPMYIPARDSTFNYVQRAQTDADGSFEMTLPYSTTGYDEFGPENGYTNVSVRAEGSYSFFTNPSRSGPQNLTTVRWQSQANVSEAQVVGEDDSPVEVTLEEEVLDRPDGANNSTAPTNNSTAPPTNDSTEAGNDSTAETNDSSALEAPGGLDGALAAPTALAVESATSAATPARATRPDRLAYDVSTPPRH